MKIQAPGITPWYRQRWPWLLMAGPAIVAAASLFSGWLALTRPDALVVGDYYNQGKAINVDLRRDRAATALRMHMDLAYDPKTGHLDGDVTSAGAAARGPVRLRMMHSTLPDKDISLDIVPDQNGRFTVALPLLEMARWHVQAEGSQGDWRLAATWSWPQQKQISLNADIVDPK